MTQRLVVVDFETGPIGRRPAYPPRAHSVAIKDLGLRRAGAFIGWGHADSRRSNRDIARSVLEALWRDPSVSLIFHHAKFDLEVAREEFGLAPPPWHRVHDTLFLAFLCDPYAYDLRLKQLAVKHLDEPPAERDELKEWIIANVPEAKQKKSEWFKYFDRAPDGLVGRYAIGDVERTAKLFKLFHAQVVKQKMGAAYDRERRLLPHLLTMEATGVPVATERLAADTRTAEATLARADDLIRKRLKAPGLEVDKNEKLADALEAADVVEGWILTAKGKRSTAADALAQTVSDKPLVQLLDYRSLLATSLRTFMLPWLSMAQASGGRVFTNWNQVRQDADSSGGAGTKTGRLSSNPNFQNIPVWKTIEFTQIRDAFLRELKKLPPLPKVRSYIVPPKRGGAIVGRDYSQQEFRVLGHYEAGPLLDAYLADPKMDVHVTAQVMINEMLKRNFERKPIKNTGFGLVYGMGKAKLAASTGTDMETAVLLKRTYLAMFPGIKDLIDDLKGLAARGEPFRTWGGRLYYCEPPFGHRTFDYRMLNTLIQGSSADITKEAMIRYMDVPENPPLYLTVHDELNTGVDDKRDAPIVLEALRVAMESIELDVPLLSDGAWSTENWGMMK